MACRKNSIDNEQDNITSFRHFLVTFATVNGKLVHVIE